MKCWSFYEGATGRFIGRRFMGLESALAANTPSGCQAIEGVFDHLAQRVDLEAGRVVEWQPPQPDADHEWNATTRRWQKRPEVAARELRRAVAIKRIADLERAQARTVRELLVAQSARLKEIDDEIAALRADVNP